MLKGSLNEEGHNQDWCVDFYSDTSNIAYILSDEKEDDEGKEKRLDSNGEEGNKNHKLEEKDHQEKDAKEKDLSSSKEEKTRKGKCRYYERGEKCPRRKCVFIHEQTKQNGDRRENNRDGRHKDNQEKDEKEKDQPGKEERRITQKEKCWYSQRGETCPRSKCVFIHEQTKKGDHPREYQKDRYQHHNRRDFFQKNTHTNSMECWFFNRGRCNRGSECKYSHKVSHKQSEKKDGKDELQKNRRNEEITRHEDDKNDKPIAKNEQMGMDQEGHSQKIKTKEMIMWLRKKPEGEK